MPHTTTQSYLSRQLIYEKFSSFCDNVNPDTQSVKGIQYRGVTGDVIKDK